MGGAGFWLYANRSSESAQASGGNATHSTLHLDTFVLNLADADRAYLRVGIDLAINQDSKHAAEAAPVSQVRDAILDVLSQAKADELLSSAGKKKLKQDIVRALHERVPQLGVEEVYFTEFLVQR